MTIIQVTERLQPGATNYVRWRAPEFELMANPRHLSILLLTFLILATPTHAHFPVLTSGNTGTTPENAVFIDDATNSHAIYHELTNDAPQLWVTFNLQIGDNIYTQLGIPVLNRLADFRPSVAVLGPGLPAVDLPFEIPSGLGGLLLETEDVTDPEFFHEHFTGTESWILGKLEDTAPESGQYYLVAYAPAGDTGKLWVAVGRREVFEPDDIGALAELVPQVSEFHETDATGLITPFLPCFAPVVLACAGFWGSVWLLQRRLA